MEEIKIKSSISQQEMNENFSNFNFFDGLMEALKEIYNKTKSNPVDMDIERN